jgi:hypothetical protein
MHRGHSRGAAAGLRGVNTLAYICAMCPAAQQSPDGQSPDPRSSIEPSREGACPWSYTTRIAAPASPS